MYQVLNPSGVAFSSDGAQRVILDRTKLGKGEPIIILGNSCTSPLPGCRGRVVQGGPGDHTRSSRDKYKHLMQAIDQKTWGNPWMLDRV